MHKEIVKQLFKFKKVPVSPERIICAAICTALPIVIGFLFDIPRYGMWASIGGFTYMYVANEPYAQRIKKMFLIAIAITFCSTLGILLTNYPWFAILMVGIIGSVSTFIFGALSIRGPAAIFFIMTFTMTIGIKMDRSTIPVFALSVLVGGLFSWLVSMIGYFHNPHGPEKKRVNKLYSDLFQFANSIGKTDLTTVKSNLVNSLEDTEAILTTGYVKWKISPVFNRLYLLNEYANKMFLEMLHFNENNKLPDDIIFVIKKLQKQINLQSNKKISIKKIDKGIYPEYDRLLEIVYDIESIMNIPLEYIGNSVEITKPSLPMLIRKSIDKNSIVFRNSLKYGIILMVAAFVAYKLDIPKTYWIVLSCASVMYGSTIMTTFHRSIQRSIGTIFGVGVAMCIGYLNPQSYLIAVFNGVLTILTEVIIAKNYALATIFFTPNAILIAEASSNAYTTANLASARMINIVIGSAIGLIGTFLIGRKSASSSLNDLMVKTLHGQAKMIFALGRSNERESIDTLKQKIEIDFDNFNLAYNTALGEIPNDEEKLEMMWPIVYGLERINYLLAQCWANEEKINISNKQLEDMVFVYESMANNIDLGTKIYYREIEICDGIESLCKEINSLQEYIIKFNN